MPIVNTFTMAEAKIWLEWFSNGSTQYNAGRLSKATAQSGRTVTEPTIRKLHDVAIVIVKGGSYGKPTQRVERWAIDRTLEVLLAQTRKRSTNATSRRS